MYFVDNSYLCWKQDNIPQIKVISKVIDNLNSESSVSVDVLLYVYYILKVEPICCNVQLPFCHVLARKEI